MLIKKMTLMTAALSVFAIVIPGASIAGYIDMKKSTNKPYTQKEIEACNQQIVDAGKSLPGTTTHQYKLSKRCQQWANSQQDPASTGKLFTLPKPSKK